MFELTPKFTTFSFWFFFFVLYVTGSGHKLIVFFSSFVFYYFHSHHLNAFLLVSLNSSSVCLFFAEFLHIFSHTWCTYTHSTAWPRTQLIDCIVHGLMHFSGLYQFIDVVKCGEHGRLVGIFGIGALFIHIMAILSILSVSCGTHILEESQYLHVVACRFS